MRPLSKVETRHRGSISSLTLYFLPSVFTLFCVFCRSSALLSCAQNSSDQPELVNHKGIVLTDSQITSESFNSDFFTIGLDLTTKYNGQDTNANTKFLSTSNISSLFISLCSETEVIQQIYSIKNNGSFSYDEISSRFFILAAEVLATPLKIFTFSFESVFFSRLLKNCQSYPGL